MTQSESRTVEERLRQGLHEIEEAAGSIRDDAFHVARVRQVARDIATAARALRELPAAKEHGLVIGEVDRAWKEAEVALPEGWWIERLERRGTEVEYIGGKREHADWWVAMARGPKDAEQHGNGPTVSTSLLALAERLRR